MGRVVVRRLLLRQSQEEAQAGRLCHGVNIAMRESNVVGQRSQSLARPTLRYDARPGVGWDQRSAGPPRAEIGITRHAPLRNGGPALVKTRWSHPTHSSCFVPELHRFAKGKLVSLRRHYKLPCLAASRGFDP